LKIGRTQLRALKDLPPALQIATGLLFTRVLGTSHEPRSTNTHYTSGDRKQRHFVAADNHTQGKRHTGYYESRARGACCTELARCD
jgi:hypothetical protein